MESVVDREPIQHPIIAAISTGDLQRHNITPSKPEIRGFPSGYNGRLLTVRV
jgi:hypothetical protein